MTVAARMHDLGTETAFEVLARARELEAQGREIIHLEIGEPDFDTPQHIVEASVEALRQGYTHYGPTPGLPELREAIARNSREVRGVDTAPSQVVVTPGAKPIMFYVMLALGEPGVEIIYPNPGFPIYESMVKFSGATPVPMQLLEKRGYHPDLADLADKMSDRTRLIILNSPNNPCGSVFTREELEQIAALAQQYSDCYVLADEIYKDILYTGEHHSIAAFPGMADRTIILDGFSKSYAMTGWRLGYGVFPPALFPYAERLAINSYSCPNAATQYAAVEALTGPQEAVEIMTTAFDERRQVIVKELNDVPGISCVDPGGAFYAFPNISETGIDARTLQERLLEEAGLAVIAGTSFGHLGEGYLRFSYAASLEQIVEGVERMRRLLANS